MSGFDDMGVFFVDTFTSDEVNGGNDANKINFMGIKKKLKDFLRVFHTGNFNYVYRDALKNNYNSGRYWLEIDLKDLNSYDEELGELVKKQPTEALPLVCCDFLFDYFVSCIFMCISKINLIV